MDKNTHISEMGFCSRTYNCLARAGLNTLGEIINTPYDKILRIRNLGRNGLNEIISILADEGFSLQLSEEYQVSEKNDFSEIMEEIKGNLKSLKKENEKTQKKQAMANKLQDEYRTKLENFTFIAQRENDALKAESFAYHEKIVKEKHEFDALTKEIKSLKEKKEALEKQLLELSECESPEARDRLRLANIFKEMVSIDEYSEKGEKMKYVEGLGLILSGVKTREVKTNE